MNAPRSQPDQRPQELRATTSRLRQGECHLQPVRQGQLPGHDGLRDLAWLDIIAKSPPKDSKHGAALRLEPRVRQPNHDKRTGLPLASGRPRVGFSTAIPPLDMRTGVLPPGIHDATWQDFASSYGSNPHRQNLLQGMHRALLELW
jgi:hypothetical protein